MNQERTAIGLWEYETDETLTKAAQIRAEEQATSFGHIRPDGRQCDTVILDVSLSYISALENAAMGQRTPEEVMESWMNSAAHKGNILSGNYGDYSVARQTVVGMNCEMFSAVSQPDRSSGSGKRDLWSARRQAIIGLS